MFCDYQDNLENTATALKVGDIQNFWERGRILYEETLHFIGRLENPLETMIKLETTDTSYRQKKLLMSHWQL